MISWSLLSRQAPPAGIERLMGETDRAGQFSSRVVVLFGGQLFGLVIGVVNGILLARLLGPAGKGNYALVVLVPSTAMVLIQLGLPQAFGYFAARGQTAGIVGKTFTLTAVLCLAAFAILLVILPVLHETIFRGIELPLILAGFLVLPLALNATFTTGVVTGRQAVRLYIAVNMAASVATLILLILILGGLGPSVLAALAVYLIASSIQTVGLVIGARRVSTANPTPERVSYRELFSYGLPMYVGSLTSHFSYRIDVYLIALLIADASAPLGFYSMAVSMAEMVFIFPGAVNTVFFPHVAGSSREDSDRQVAQVSRVTLLLSALAAVLVAVLAAALFQFVLPAFADSMQPLLVLLPGVVALSVGNVTAGYVTGIGRPGIISVIGLAAFAANVVANLILIPPFGIVGAAAASLVSYTLSSLLMTVAAARFAGSSMRAFWVPRRDDVRVVVVNGLGLLRRMRDGLTAGRGDRRSTVGRRGTDDLE
jgi:O-antigen/teichoic acid export membrane protein